MRTLPIFIPSPEHQFVLNLFPLLLTGLGLLVVLYEGYQTGDRTWRWQYRLWAGAFALLALNYLLLALRAGLPLFFNRQPPTDSLILFSHLSLLAGLSLLALGLGSRAGQLSMSLARRLMVGSAGLLGLAVLVAIAAPHALTFLPDRFLPLDLIAPFLLLPALVWTLRERVPYRSSQLALTLLIGSLVLHALVAASILPPSGLEWNLEQFAALGGYLLFLFTVGERSERLTTRFFVRLNLSFILLASLLLSILGEVTRAEYHALAQREVLEMAEYLRSHLAYQSRESDRLEEVLNEELVARRVVAEFASLGYLDALEVEFRGERATLTIDSGGRILEEYGPIVPAAQPPVPQQAGLHGRLETARFQIINLPVLIEGKQVGTVRLRGSSQYMKRFAARRIALIIALMTGMVFVSTLLTGLLVHRAAGVIQGQRQQLDETQAQLLQSAKLASIGELAGGVAHEVNNPVGIIMAQTGDLMAQPEEEVSAEVRLRLSLIDRQAERISRLTHGLLTFARREAPHLVDVNLHDLLRDTLELVAGRIATTDIELDLQLAPDLPHLSADPQQLEQVFLNLLNNAIDAMPDGGTLMIRTRSHRSPRREVSVTLADTGTGIAPDHLTRIFDPFFTTKAPGQGTGLGLSISYGIVAEHGGRIEVQSTPAQGTVFTVFLPYDDASNG